MVSMKFVVVSLAAAIVAAKRVYLPEPSGQYHVAKTQHVFNHTTHNDPVAPPDSNHTGSFIVISIYYPSPDAPQANETLQYLDPTLAGLLEEGWGFQDGSLETLWTPMRFQGPVMSGTNDLSEYPPILISPGTGMPCVLYTMLSMDIASQGYPVLCIDHPGEAPYLQIPYGGGGVYGLPMNATLDHEFIGALYKVRVSDLIALTNLYPPLVDSFGAPFNDSVYVGVGHSLGGNAMVGAMHGNKTILGGINLDGRFFGDKKTDVERPFLMMESASFPNSNKQNWAGFQKALSGWWQELNVTGSLHDDFSDLGIIAELLPKWNDPQHLLGSIGGTRMRKVMTSFVSAFVNRTLGWPERILEEKLPNKQWPEVIREASSKPDKSH